MNHTGEGGRFQQEGLIPLPAQDAASKQQKMAHSNPSYGYIPEPNHPSGGSSNLAALMRIILSRWLMVLLLGIFGGAAGLFYAQQAIPVYRATAELEMNVRRPKVVNNEAFFDDPDALSDADATFNTRFAKFKSPAMEVLATEEYMRLYPDHTATSRFDPINPHSLAWWIQDVRWYKNPDANIVYVSFESADPEFSARLVNVLSHCAGMLMVQENEAQSDEAVKWLVSRTTEKRESLEEVESDLAANRQELHLDSLEQRKIALAQALGSVSSEKEVLASKLASRETIYDFISELKDTDPNLEMLPPGLPKERELNNLISTWRSANDNLLLVADRYTKIHPQYRKAAELEERSRVRLEQFIDISTKAVQNEIKLLQRQIRQIDGRITLMKTEAITLGQSIATGLRQLQRMERERDVADNSYQAMLRRMEEARLSADENMAFTKVIRNASAPSTPISPRKVRCLALGVLLGLVCGGGLAVVLSFFTDKVGTVSDLRALGLNVLASIPTQKKVDSRGELATIGLRDKFSPIIEVFAGINAVLTSDKYINRTRMLIVSSAGPGEGKTISACNLAISSALNGSRTLLIDGDLRRPQLANVFRIEEDHPSLLTWLDQGEMTEFNKLVSHDIIKNLDMITSRPDEFINPAELLGRGGLAALLTWARENYDRVIIDTPPLGSVGDAQVFANLVDAVIMVSRIGKTRKRAIKFSLVRFKEIDSQILGWIANDVPHSLAGMFGGAEGYGFSPGYGEYKSYGRD